MRRGSKSNQNEFSVQSSVTSDVEFIVLLMGYCSVCCAIMDYLATIMIYDFSRLCIPCANDIDSIWLDCIPVSS